MAQPVEAGVPFADLPLLSKIHFSAILHSPEFLRRGGPESIGGVEARMTVLPWAPLDVNQFGHWQGHRKQLFTSSGGLSRL
jgi:hypothetical protein